MRARNENNALSVHAVAGTHVVILGLDAKGYGRTDPDCTTDLSAMLSGMVLGSSTTTAAANGAAPSIAKPKGTGAVFVGFSIDRRDCLTKGSVSLNADGRPVQKFHFGDYTVLPGRRYEYTVRRMIRAPGSRASSPKIFVTHGSPVSVNVVTEDPTKGKHGIYFNRGVAGSKAYSRKFGEYRKYHLVKKFGTAHWKSLINPRSIPDPEQSKEALAWLSRGIEEALLGFLSQASGKGHQLLAAVYEFTHNETLQAFASAVERGVDVKIIRHCKGAYRTRVKRDDIVKDEDGKIVKDWIPDDTTEAAREAIDAVGFKSLEHAHIWQHSTFIERKHSSGIMHNKFIVLVKDSRPVQVWTGSTNPTDGGIYGQSNVGHIVRDEGVAGQFLEYWGRLSKDLPGRKKLSKTEGDHGRDDENDPMDESNEQRQPDLYGPISSPSIHTIFSPRKSTDMLQWYADRMEDAKSSVHYTAAFGVAQPIAEVLDRGKRNVPEGLRRSPRVSRHGKQQDAPRDSLLRYVLLDNKPSERSSEKSRKSAGKKGKDYVDYYDFKDIQENRIAFGAILPSDGGDDNSGESLTGLTTFVDYIHTKYMIIDALTDNPLIVTGSANFSVSSTDKNDENSLIIQGDTSVADIYFTEFMRLFDHFHSRDKYLQIVANKKSTGKSSRAWGAGVEDESWLRPYFDRTSQLYRERLLLR